jgi:hypothetical protein
MLPYLLQYRKRVTTIPKRTYFESVPVSHEVKEEDFKRAIYAIEHGQKVD